MCTGLEIGALVAVVASAATSAVSAVDQGIGASRQAKFQAADQRQRAVREREIAAQNETDFRRDQSRLQAQRRAREGGSGVQGSTGTSLLTASDFEAEKELQALRIRAGGATNASRLENEAQLTSIAGKNARNQGFFRAGSSLLSGAGKTFSALA